MKSNAQISAENLAAAEKNKREIEAANAKNGIKGLTIEIIPLTFGFIISDSGSDDTDTQTQTE